MTDANFWHERWKKNEIPFHEQKPNPLLVKHFNRLSLPKASRIFVPLCGKTLDIHWLLKKGHRVTGAELSPVAINQLFTELKLHPTIAKAGLLTRYSAPNIDIFVGDIFKLTRQRLGPIDAIYDRAALVALPENIRRRYAAHLIRLTNKAPQLLDTFTYDQAAVPGPPHSISNPEIVQLYATTYDIHLLSSAPIPGGLKGKYPATENFWHLKPK
jgi:thiopurine S-methyltransferase